ncbi:hypothetical protein LPJ61_002638 [Coemansia biformis]|uniref:C2H2-type domain-containing protein n=1 Tax=Coemansia biformis TaxID=1286918 RepID=A0A9W8CYH1_9FUNG|nr:hypothetical protein LPJ61_002638 [Coemansia biformis]
MKPLYVPAKRRLAANDPFFTPGNVEAAVHFVCRHVVCTHDPVSREAHVRGIVDSMLDSAATAWVPIVCHDPPCHGSVECPSAHAYEKHYDQVHRHCCRECGAVLPGAHWLDLHIQECHDAFFRARVARGEKPYQCLLRTCARTFSRPHKRRLHMLDKHHFAHSFDWDLVRRGLRPAGGRPTSKSGGGRAGRESEARSARGGGPENQPATASGDAQSTGADQRMDVDQLTSAFKRSLSVGAPRSVSFGRRGGRRQGAA